MATLILVSVLGLFLLVAGVYNVKNSFLDIAVKLGLGAALVVNFSLWGTEQSYFNDMFRVDTFTIAFSGFLIAAVLLMFFFSSPFTSGIKSYLPEHYVLFVFALVGMLAIVGFNNLSVLFVGIEILSICLYALAGSNKKDLMSNEAALKYFLLGAFTTGIMLMGIALVYAETSTFSLPGIAAYVSGAAAPGALLILGVLLLFASMAFKVSAVPFHYWAPDVYQGAPSFVTVFMSAIVKSAAAIAFFKLFAFAFPGLHSQWGLLFAICAAASITIGGLSAAKQDSVKRLLAFSGISHAGYLLIAVLVFGGGYHALFFYVVSYTLSSLAMFAVIMQVQAANGGSDSIAAFNGLIKKSPFLAIMLAIALCSMAGIPLTSGFIAKFYILTGALSQGWTWLVVIALINALVGIYYYFKVLIAAFFTESENTNVPAVSLGYKLALVIVALGIIVLGILPDLIYF